MTRFIRLGPPVPPNRIARWAVPGLIAALALLGVLQQHRSLAVAVPALAAAAAAAALLVMPARPAAFTAGVALAAGALAVLGNGSASDLGWFGVCVLAGWCAYVGSARVTIALWAAAVLTFSLEWTLTTDDRGWASWIAGTTFATFGLLLTRRERDLAEQLRIAQAGLADRARAQERNRIARELHDVIAHSLTVSLLHVSSARLAVEENAADAVSALAQAERLGRECLTEVRQVVGLLRRDEGASTAPLPGAAQLTALVDQFRRAGADIALDVDGDPAELTATVGLAFYRVLQEALTNAARHAPGAPVRAALSVTADGGVLLVDSAGPPGSGAGGGLASMRERAAALGGVCTAGPAGGAAAGGSGAGGWRVRAEIPLAAAGSVPAGSVPAGSPAAGSPAAARP
ncbi:MAG TPA: histidine kinase [Streptosporangiaceae bacterium]